MAAGLPCVVSDWDGYRDTVRDNVDGFRIPTWSPRPGLGVDLAHRYANGWLGYDNYVGLAAQVTAVDLARAAQAISVFVRHPRIAREMGEAAQLRARAEFDWAAIIPRYQALWAELATRRAAAPAPAGPQDNPWRMDPFRLFAGYATRHLSARTRLSLAAGVTQASALAMLQSPLAGFTTLNFPTPAEVELIIDRLAAAPGTAVEALLAAFPQDRRYFLERGFLWLAKFGVLRLDDPA